MKTLKITLIGLALIAAGALSAQSHYQGKVTAAEPYEVYILHLPKEGDAYWIRWDIWEYYEEYRITVQPFDRIEAIWVSQCSRDTIARAYFNGERKRNRQKADIAIQPGDTFEMGNWPFRDRLTAKP